MRKEKKVNIYQNDNKRFLIVAVMMLSIIVSMFSYWIFAYHYKYGILPIKGNIINFKPDYYVDIKGDMIYLENIDAKINQDFVNKQKEMLKKEIIDTDMTKGIYDDILSIKISYLVRGDAGNYNEVLTENIDLRQEKVISDIDLLDKVDSGYKLIAKEIFDEYIKIDNTNITVIDSITEDKLSVKEFNENEEKYVIRIREKLPDIMKLYIEDGKLYGNFNLIEINKVCYKTNNDVIKNIDKEIGQI